MKKIISISVIAVLMMIASVNVSAQEGIIYENIYNEGQLLYKEHTKVEAITKHPILKRTYVINSNGQALETIDYKWDSVSSGWEAVKKYEYKYTDDNLLASTTHMKWDNKNRRWSDNIDQMIYHYNMDKNLTSVDKVNKKRTQFLAENK